MSEPIDPTSPQSPQPPLTPPPTQTPPPGQTPPPPPPLVNTAVEDGKTIAIIAYLTIIGLIVALVLNMEKKNTFAAYHVRQSLGLMLTALAISFISWIPLLGWLIGLVAMVVLLYMWISGLLNALNGREKPLPILGNKYMEWFKTI